MIQKLNMLHELGGHTVLPKWILASCKTASPSSLRQPSAFQMPRRSLAAEAASSKLSFASCASATICSAADCPTMCSSSSKDLCLTV